MRRLRLARDAAIVALVLPASVLRAAIAQATAGNIPRALSLIAAIPELEAIAVNFIFEGITA